MGNHCVEGIPALIVRNWHPVPDKPNSFRNRVTMEYAHKHIVTVDDSIEIQSFKYRMHQNNPYVCRVLYYHHYHDTIYHVYTDQMHAAINLKYFEKWVQDKIKIVEAFRNLAQLFGYMRVCRQMIGADSNGNPKIWVHPDPVASVPWSPCELEAPMIADISAILFSIEEGSRNSRSNKSFDSQKRMFTTFEECISEETRRLQNFHKKTRLNHSSTHIENSTTNFNININIELDSKSKSKKYQPPNSNAEKLQKIFAPVVCETTRNEAMESKKISVSKKFTQEKQSRPYTQYPMTPGLKHKTQNNTKRRDSDFLQKLEIVHQHSRSIKKMRGKVISAVPSVGKKESDEEERGRKIEKSILGKFFSITPKSFARANQTQSRMDNTSKKCFSKKERYIGKQQTLKEGIVYKPSPKSKNTSIPDFLTNRFTEQPEARYVTCSSVEKYSSTDRKSRQDYYKEHYQNEPSSQDRKYRQSDKNVGQGRERKNTMIMIKEELNSILDSPSMEAPVSESYQIFKESSYLYKPTYEEEQVEEMEQIKEKVEKKKATFAHLKLEAMKILDDDF